MPIYEYRCNDCGNIFEILTTSSKTEEKVQCSRCKSDQITKLISSGSFKLTSGTGLSSTVPSGCGGKSGFT